MERGEGKMVHKPDVSVVVVTYERDRHLDWCLQALAYQSLPKERYEVIVVNDGDLGKGSFLSVRGFSCPPSNMPFKFIWHPHRGWGLAYSRNEGVALSRGHIFVIIDADILLNPKALEAYWKLYQSNPARVIGGYYKYLKGMEISYEAIQQWAPIWNMELPEVDIPQHEYQYLGNDVRETHYLFGWMTEDLFADEEKTYRNPFSLLGGNIMVPRHIWEQTEGFDEGMTHYGGEDAEFSLQVAALGYPFSFSIAAGGCHMAHPKQPGAEKGTEQALVYIRKKWPRWFDEDGEPIWAHTGGWEYPHA